MSNATQTFRTTAELELPSTPTIYNVTMPGTANTEASQLLNTGTKQFLIRCRDLANIKLAFTTAESGTNFITIPKRSSYTISDINFSGTLYFQADQASVATGPCRRCRAVGPWRRTWEHRACGR